MFSNMTITERSSGSTEDIRKHRVDVGPHFVTLIDTPGFHKRFKNMVIGITEADYALFVVSSDVKELEQRLGELRTMMLACFIAGLKRIIIAVNFMKNSPSKNFKASFAMVSEILKDMATNLQKKCSIQTLPVDALNGDNLITRSELFDFYEGEALLPMMRNTFLIPQRGIHKPLRICIDKAYSVTGVGTIITGTVIQGLVYQGQVVKLSPEGILTQIKSLHLAIPKESIEVGFPGDEVAMCLRGVSKSQCRARKSGVIAGFFHNHELLKKKIEDYFLKKEPGADGKSNETLKEESEKLKKEFILPRVKELDAPMFPAKSFEATLQVVNKMGTIKKGWNPCMHVHNAQVPVVLEQILNVSKPSKSRTTTCAEELFEGDVALVRFGTQKPTAVDLQTKCPKLGRFILRDGFVIVAAGLIIQITF